jgi:hypothetical protein
MSKDWREQYTNCHDCAEFQDNNQPTELCKQCQCFNCTYDRSKCLARKWCQRDNEEIELLNE